MYRFYANAIQVYISYLSIYRFFGVVGGSREVSSENQFPEDTEG